MSKRTKELATMTLGKIAAAYLREHGADGLCYPWIFCGCGIDDLMPCDHPSSNCQPARARKATQKDVDAGCECDVGDMIYCEMEE